MIDVLIVDDSEDDYFLLKRAFGNTRFNILSRAENGLEAIAYLKDSTKKPPSIILMDIHMPKMNGLETLEKIKADSDLKHIPIIMLTTSDDLDDIKRSYRASVSGFINKPVGRDEINQMTRIFNDYWGNISKLP